MFCTLSKGGYIILSKYKLGDVITTSISEIKTGTESDYFALGRLSKKIFSESEIDQISEDVTSEPAIEVDKIKDESFKEGVKFAQSVYKSLHKLSRFELTDMFGTEGGSAWAVINRMSVEEIDSKIKSYNFNIRVFDKFLVFTEEGQTKVIMITKIEKDSYSSDQDTCYYICTTGEAGSATAGSLKLALIKRLPLDKDELNAVDLITRDRSTC